MTPSSAHFDTVQFLHDVQRVVVQVVVQVLAQEVLTPAPRPVERRHAAELGQHGALIRAELIHRVLLWRPLLRDHQAWVVLVQVWGPSLHLGGDVMGGRLWLHAGGGA